MREGWFERFRAAWSGSGWGKPPPNFMCVFLSFYEGRRTAIIFVRNALLMWIQGWMCFTLRLWNTI